MALVRPDKRARLETQIVEILTEVRGLKEQVRDLRTVLMGAGEQGETQFGRLPMVEQKLARVENEMELLKQMRLAARNYWNVASIAGHVLTACGGGLTVALCQLAIRLVR